MKKFSNVSYPTSHWAMKKFELEKMGDSQNNNLVAIFTKNGNKNKGFAFYLNPTDCRGYRSIVRLFDNDNMGSTFNRDFTFDEQMGLGKCLQVVSHVYQQIVPLTQVLILGNNSHSFDSNDRNVLIGTDKEPNMLHGHVIGRGDPKIEYVQGIRLHGPLPGESFDLINYKIKWHTDLDITTVGRVMKDTLQKSKTIYEKNLQEYQIFM